MSAYNIEAGVLYADTEVQLAISLIKDGAVLTTATLANAAIYSLDGTLLDSFDQIAAPDAQGNFTFANIERQLASPAMYYIKVSIKDGVTTLSRIIYPKNL